MKSNDRHQGADKERLTMTDLRKRAEDYAKDALKRYDDIMVWKVDVFRLVAEAYEQGYIECDTKEYANNE